MKHALLCALAIIVTMPAAAAMRPTPSRLPSSRSPEPAEMNRGGWDTRPQDKWDRQLLKCLNDRRQSRRERRDCADMGMPVRRR